MTATTKAIIAHQPHPTLIATGVKQWETRGAPPNGPMRPDGVRGMPGLAIGHGERIAIVAAAKAPALGPGLGDWTVYRQCGEFKIYDSDSERVRVLPLGRVVATAVVAEALPIVADHTQVRSDCVEFGPDLRRSGWRLRLYRYLGHIRINGHVTPEWRCSDISDQLPYGHWSLARWAWRLTDVEAVDGEVKVTRGNRQGVFEIEVTW